MSMHSSPFFSVIIPTYNRASFLKKAVDSILCQTYKDFEVVIVDDASTDNTLEIVKSIEDDRIVYIKNEKNIERSAARNRGIDIANGKYLCFLDSDDYFLENHLSNFYKEIENKNFPVATFFGSAYNKLEGKELQKRFYPDFKEENKFAYILKHTFGLPLSCVHSDIFKKHKLDTEIEVCEDLDFFLRVAKDFPIIKTDNCDYVYNLHADCFTMGDKNKAKREYNSYTKIFKKAYIKNELPSKGKNRLLSMCYYNFAVTNEAEKEYLKMYSNIIRSYFYFPKGYNGKTNKIMLVMFVYHFPILGFILKSLKRFF